MTAPARPVPRCEMDVLFLMAEGRTLAQIATLWGVQRGTVHTFAARLRRRLGAETNPQAIILACRLGLLDGRPQHHGDHNGYEAHIRRGDRGDAICDACRAGEKAYRADRRRAQQAREGATRRLSRPNGALADSGPSGLENASEAHSRANRPTHQTKAA